MIYDFKYIAQGRCIRRKEAPNVTEQVIRDEQVARPGKIIAIHLSYASRADQRGRRPAHPSYFFKVASSVGASGGPVERPAGPELLAFEGEIALVIGPPARHVSIEDAWSHVAYVTAANDLGLYALR